MKRQRMDVNLEELDQIIDRGTHAPLSESEGEKAKRVLHASASACRTVFPISRMPTSDSSRTNAYAIIRR